MESGSGTIIVKAGADCFNAAVSDIIIEPVIRPWMKRVNLALCYEFYLTCVLSCRGPTKSSLL